MAVVLPSTPLPGTPASELKVRRAFSLLGPDWHVVQSVRWQSPSGRQRDGEADFVLLHPQYGLIVVEVKGGGIAVNGNTWSSTDRHGQQHDIKDPFTQAATSKHVLVQHLREIRTELPYIPASHCVAFPDIALTAGLGPQAPIDLILDRTVLSDAALILAALQQAVARCCPDRQPALSRTHLAAIANRLAPTIAVRRPLSIELDEVGDKLLQLTNQQIRVLDVLRRQRRALIVGAAGTGKTILAIAKAQRLASEGFSVGLVCHSVPLAQYLAHHVRDEHIWTGTVWELEDFARQRPREANGQVMSSPSLEETLSAITTEQIIESGLSFDALVVDEAQRVRPILWPVLDVFLTHSKESPYYVFADPRQSPEGTTMLPFDVPPYELTVNCRNTRQIAAAVAKFESDSEESLGADGPSPKLISVSNVRRMRRAVSHTVDRLIAEGVSQHDIRILTVEYDIDPTSREQSDSIRAGVPSVTKAGTTIRFEGVGRSYLGGPVSVVPQEGDVRPGIRACGARQFAGLESRVVIGVIGGLDPTDLYILLSRATSYLVIIGLTSPMEVLSQRIGLLSNS